MIEKHIKQPKTFMLTADSQVFHGDEQHGQLASHSLQCGWLNVLATRSLGFQKCGCNSFL